MVYSNIVRKDQLRKIQLKTLKIISDALIPSFGPMGSNTVIKKGNAFTMYTKDGHTILSNIVFNGAIEQSIKDDLEDQTKQIVLEYGDGTTSAIILSNILFKNLIKLEGLFTPFDIVDTFKKVTEDIGKYIKSQGHDATLDDIYNIALISTNNNADIAQNIVNVYKEYGMSVFIDVGISNITENIVKIYDGMSLDTGYSDTMFINTSEGVCRIRDAHIFVFEDPIDTPEMASMFDTIVANNILKAYGNNDNAAGSDPIPTVVLAPRMSKDMSATMDSLTAFISKFPDNTYKPPFLLITDIHQYDQFLDIAKLSGSKLIHKYLDPDMQKRDIERGLAPTPETIFDFAGHADLVESSVAKTKVINPMCMYNEDGEPSDIYTSLINYLEAELAKAKEEGEDANVTGVLKRRINSLESNMVEYLVGGVSVSDRDSVRALVEDAVLACRSAALNGVGFGANFEGLRSSGEIYNGNRNNDELYKLISRDIFLAYQELTMILYKTIGLSDDSAKDTVLSSMHNDITSVAAGPYNLRTKLHDRKVLASIDSDIVILRTLSKIITLMATSNQFIVQSPMMNTYYADDQVELDEDDK